MNSIKRNKSTDERSKSRAKARFGYALQEGRRRSQMITKDEIQELLHSTETYRVERTTSTGDMDKFQEVICAFANDLPNSRKKGYLILGAYDNGGSVVGKDVGKVGGKNGGKNGGKKVPSFVPSCYKSVINLS